ncbi:MAG: sulfate reduction electron transfer complex DsrMKJOP subunit DsrK [Candidatus Nitrospinota bacterium M3_3B_026]
MADVKAPEITGKIKIPEVNPEGALPDRPNPAAEEHNTGLGFPGKLVDNWQEAAVEKMGELLGKYKSLRLFLDICVKCGSCADKCHYYIGTGDPNNMPVARQELLRKVYRKYFTVGGKVAPGLVRAEELTEDVLDDWWNYFHQCSQCRRCSVFCPYGIDTAEISMAAREIMDSIGMGQKYCNEILNKVLNAGNNLGLQKNALANTLEFVEEDVEEEDGVAVKYPLDQKGADVLLIPPSADFFSSPHIEGFTGYGKVFHEAGVSWTVSSHASEFANFGMFIGNFEVMRKVAHRIREAAEDLGVKRIIVGECGHAWRVGYSFWNTLIGPWDFLDPKYKNPTHIVEFTLDLIKRDGIKIDKTANDEHVVTFHDSCNVARASRMGDRPGGQFELPRELIRAVCNNYVDMDEDTIREKTFCCGGGGGLLTDELMNVRVRGAQPRAEALKDVMDRNGVNTMASICAICKAQFTKVLPYYGIDMDVVASVHQLVSNAIVLGGKKGV